VGWRRRPRTLNEELLAEAAREGDLQATAAGEDHQQARSWLVLIALWIGGALLVLSLKWAVEFLLEWAQIGVGVFVVAHLVRIFLRSTRLRSAGAARGLRVLLLAWLALCIGVTVLVAIGGFQQDDLALLGLVWPILGLIWIAYRLRATALARTAS
jgi:hypothetical protein